MITAFLAVLGFAALFAVTGLIPLEKGSCHGGECSAENVADCLECPFGPGADESRTSSQGRR